MPEQYAAVIINRKAAAVDRIFHYKVPVELRDILDVGWVVRVPFQHEILDGIVVDWSKQAEVPEEKLREICGLVGDKPLFSRELLALGEWLADYYLCPKVSALQSMLPAGLNLTGKLPQKVVEKRVYLVPNATEPRNAKKQQLVWSYLQQHNGALRQEVLTIADSSILRAMQKKGIIQFIEKEVWDIADIEVETFVRELTKEQKQVLKALAQEETAANRPILLWGVTGSGKTEVYLQRAKEVLAAGKQVLFLVPEIALTPQMVDMLQGRLGRSLAVLHSGLLPTERRKTWLAIAEGQYDVVVGARSAIFAPLERLGLILLDEEHEQSYKQENVPRFHAREVARQRCRYHNAQLILGSATPSLESFYKAKQGEYLLLTMARRVGDRPLPDVKVVDMRQELRQGNRSIFSFALQEAMSAHLEQGKQTVLFLNRRGFATFVSCRSCGYVVECPHCALPMAYHQKENRLKCHYCGHTEKLPQCCPACGSAAIRHFGVGTQKVAEMAAQLFPQARIARMDRDSIVDRDAYARIYHQMKNGDIDILVGTQMVAKGLDFPGVTLVGVIAADTALNLPEMTAGERTFQLLTQVAGRAGRATAGQVIIQTYQPEQDAIQTAAQQDYLTFYEKEIQRREAFFYPPFSTIIRLVVSGLKENNVSDAAQDIVGYFGKYKKDQDWLVGPAPAPYSKVKDRYRYQLMLRGKDLTELRQLVCRGLAEARQQCRWAKDIQILVDVEPGSMM